MEITLLNILRQRLHIKLLQLQSCVAPFRICKDLKREKRKTHISTNNVIDLANVEFDTTLTNPDQTKSGVKVTRNC